MGIARKYWFVPHVVHAGDFSHWLMRSFEWDIECDADGREIAEGDYVYLANQSDGVYAWGVLNRIRKAINPTDKSSIKISRGAIKNTLIPAEAIRTDDVLKDLLLFKGGKLNFLLNAQVRRLNSLLIPATHPPMPNQLLFVLNQQIDQDENLHAEYKLVNTKQIPNKAYECALAFLKQAGGSVFFGIADDHTVVGISADAKERDFIARSIENKLSDINPRILPGEDYVLDIHEVFDEIGNRIRNLSVIELEVKADPSQDHTSKSGKSFLKSYSGRIRLR